VAVIAGIEVGVVYMPFALVRDGLLLFGSHGSSCKSSPKTRRLR